MGGTPTTRLFLRALPALALCVLATLFFSEAKLTKYTPTAKETAEVHAGKLLPAQSPRVFKPASVRVRLGSTPPADAPLWTVCFFALIFFAAAGRTAYHAAPDLRPVFAWIPSLYLRPPPQF
ncbi:MAG TPA: hypothetical protein VG893_13660 [Terracidiphilus sp.]|nr:hypothetical protein [Terracidiphilus sp.]